ncbi:hypothetical protein P43SY_000354 [Pythium insidiosum]|uniref:Uncharacterized protein n=1 Tax=Pythium insidiosum TaxID=114742 RepID=A0AAD5Q2W0_PYTIN|nr:hypothetical protein P43SY_000354 [Pythium insidiosum]KAJ0395162.1 hypothetical protein ATCC90586_005066 [Pythium insidiosum]
MAAAVSEFFGLALARVVDQFWRSRDNNEIAPPLAHMDDPIEPSNPQGCCEASLKPEVKTRTARRKSRKSAQRKHKRQAIDMNVSLATKSRSLSLTSEPSDCSSNASTCASSDEEDNVEDIGEKEMRLMRERADEIKRLSVSVIRSPVRITNATNGLWNWTVFAGFAVDLDNRRDRQSTRHTMRQVFCDVDDEVESQDESRWCEIVEEVLVDA